MSSNAPSHLSKAVFEEFRRELSNKIFEDIGSLQAVLTTGVLEPYWREAERLRSLTGFPDGERQPTRCDVNNSDRY